MLESQFINRRQEERKMPIISACVYFAFGKVSVWIFSLADATVKGKGKVFCVAVLIMWMAEKWLYALYTYSMSKYNKYSNNL